MGAYQLQQGEKQASDICRKIIDKPPLKTLYLTLKPTDMLIISKALFHKVNGTTIVSELTEMKGMVFPGEKELEKYKRKKLKELLGENSPFLDLDTNRSSAIICYLVIPPQGVEELPQGWKPEPVMVTELTQNQPRPSEPIIEHKFQWQQPKFKNRQY